MILVGFLVANEFLRDRLSNLTLLVSLYALVSFSFFTFFLPVFTGFMNVAVLLIGALLSGAVALGVVRLVYRKVPNRSPREAVTTSLSAIAVIGTLVGFYFLNWIPRSPCP